MEVKEELCPDEVLQGLYALKSDVYTSLGKQKR